MLIIRHHFDRQGPRRGQLVDARTLLRAVAGAATFAGIAAIAAPALAGGQTKSLTLTDGPSRSVAEQPELHLDYLLNDPTRRAAASALGSDDLEIALSSPDNGVFRFLFSPRPQFGLSLDKVTGNRGYAGLTWNLFDSESLFGNVGLAGSYDPGIGAPNDPLGRTLTGPSVMLHGALELGYHIGPRHSLSLSLDQGRTPDLKLNSETTDNLRLRYGLKF